jgi:hypothetical protein
MSKTKTKTNPIGRPESVAPIIRKHALLFISKTPNEILDIIFPQLQPKMRGGVTDDPQIIRKQRTSAYQQLIRFKKHAKEDGKKISFRGREIAGVRKFAWIHKEKKKIDSN